MYRLVVKKCNIILDIERLNPNIRGPGSFICKVGVKGTKEGFHCMSCIMLHPNMKD